MRDSCAPVLVITISLAPIPVSTLSVDLIRSDYDFYVNNLNAILRERDLLLLDLLLLAQCRIKIINSLLSL